MQVMKKQCDDRRDSVDHMLAAQREKVKSKSTKGEAFSPRKIQVAQEEYEEATLFIFRLKSLKQGQSRSLLTQAARYHAAQLTFFRKEHKSLEAIEPHVKLVAEQQHIDYQFGGLDDDGTEDDDYGYDPTDDGELSFDYGQNEKDEQNQEVSTSRNSMERGHQNSLEMMPSFFVGLLVGGVQHPLIASGLGLLYIVARFFYFNGYSTGEPANRLKIGGLSFVALIGLLICTASLGVHLLIRESL